MRCRKTLLSCFVLRERGGCGGGDTGEGVNGFHLPVWTPQTEGWEAALHSQQAGHKTLCLGDSN